MPQSTVINGFSDLRLRRCTARAATSFPTPVSPVIRTVESIGAALDDLDRVVDPFEKAGVESPSAMGQDARQIRLEPLGEAAERFDPAAYGPAVPVLPEAQSGLRITEIPEMLQAVLEQVDDKQGAVGGQIPAQLVEFGLLGQPSVPEEENHFLKAGVLRQRMNVKTAIAEDSLMSVDVTDLALAGVPERRAAARKSRLGQLQEITRANQQRRQQLLVRAAPPVDRHLGDVGDVDRDERQDARREERQQSRQERDEERRRDGRTRCGHVEEEATA